MYHNQFSVDRSYHIFNYDVSILVAVQREKAESCECKVQKNISEGMIYDQLGSGKSYEALKDQLQKQDIGNTIRLVMVKPSTRPKQFSCCLQPDEVNNSILFSPYCLI